MAKGGANDRHIAPQPLRPYWIPGYFFFFGFLVSFLGLRSLATEILPSDYTVLPIAPGPYSNSACLMVRPVTSMRERSVVPIPAASASLSVLSPRRNGFAPRSALGS